MFEFELPDLGEGVAEGEVLAWHVAMGDTVREDDVLADVETDKAAVDVPSPVGGVVRELHAEVGEVVATGEVLVSIAEGEATAASDGRVFAPPSVRRLAREAGVDLTAVSGSGPSGRITESNVEAAATGANDDGPTSVVSKVGGDDGESPDAETSEADRREPYRGVRRTIGERMARSRREVPHATHHDIVAVSGLVEARERLQPLAEERGVDLTYTPLLLQCVAAALDDHPVLATQLDEEREEIIYRGARDLGVATATDHGLVIPVVEDVDERGLLELASELSELLDRARNRDIAPEEMRGGVFTVTNFGAIGGEYADPVINVPETATLGVGALKERGIVEDGDVVAKPTLTLSLAIDHRVIDSADAARFVNTLKQYLADPTRLLLD